MKILFNLIGDLYRTYVPEENVSDYRFAFLVHPRHLKDVYRKFPFFKYFPDSIVNFILSKLWPVTVSRITGLKSLKTGKELRGYVISIPITATQMLDDRNLAVAKILQALRMARNKGAKIVALGALTSSVSHGGLLLKDKVSGVHITTGHAYTGINVTETLQKICEKLDIDIRNRTVAVVGATGSIGSISAEILAKYGVKKFLLIDVDRKKERFESLLNNLHSINPHLEVEITSDMNLLKNVSLVITATNAKGAVIHKEHIKSGTIIVDDAQPSDVAEDLLEREDVLVAEAGVVYTPGISINFNVGLKHKEDNFCCMAEVLVLAKHEHEGHFVLSRASLQDVEKILEMRRETNFEVGQFQNKLGYVDIDKFKRYTHK